MDGHFSLIYHLVGFLSGECSRGGVFLTNPKDSVWKDWGTLGKIRGITTPLKNSIIIAPVLSLSMKGQLGVPLTMCLWYLLCSLGILQDYNP